MTGGNGFDRAAAVTRSMLGYGVVAGVFYLVVGLLLAVTRDGFDLSRHPLSALMLGPGGWMQRANLIVTGVMVVVAAVGFVRALRGVPGARSGTFLLAFGACLVASGIFAPDPVAGFPPGATGDEATAAGILHLLFGALGFFTLAVAALLLAAWYRFRGGGWRTAFSRVCGVIILIGFVAGAALATRTAGVLLLWLAVVVGWVWLAVASIDVYRSVPHPDIDRRRS